MITPREAATIMLVKDAPEGGIEVFMLKRNLQLDFVGGAYVFPGGAVDAGDGQVVKDQSLIIGDDREASATLGITEGGLRFWVAAVRECFEESGIMLAKNGGGTPSEIDGDTERLANLRAQLNRGEVTFKDILERESLVVSAADLSYFAHWITPEGAPRRYDTRFFIASAPIGQLGEHDNSETVDSTWISPQDALERHHHGEFELVLPTRKNLEAISRFETADALFAYLNTDREVVRVAPRMIPEGNGSRIVLPGDPDF